MKYLSILKFLTGIITIISLMFFLIPFNNKQLTTDGHLALLSLLAIILMLIDTYEKYLINISYKIKYSICYRPINQDNVITIEAINYEKVYSNGIITNIKIITLAGDKLLINDKNIFEIKTIYEKK